jgi:hypothetical protein
MIADLLPKPSLSSKEEKKGLELFSDTACKGEHAVQIYRGIVLRV